MAEEFNCAFLLNLSSGWTKTAASMPPTVPEATSTVASITSITHTRKTVESDQSYGGIPPHPGVRLAAATPPAPRGAALCRPRPRGWPQPPTAGPPLRGARFYLTVQKAKAADAAGLRSRPLTRVPLPEAPPGRGAQPSEDPPRA